MPDKIPSLVIRQSRIFIIRSIVHVQTMTFTFNITYQITGPKNSFKMFIPRIHGDNQLVTHNSVITPFVSIYPLFLIIYNIEANVNRYIFILVLITGNINGVSDNRRLAAEAVDSLPFLFSGNIWQYIVSTWGYGGKLQYRCLHARSTIFVLTIHARSTCGNALKCGLFI